MAYTTNVTTNVGAHVSFVGSFKDLYPKLQESDLNVFQVYLGNRQTQKRKEVPHKETDSVVKTFKKHLYIHSSLSNQLASPTKFRYQKHSIRKELEFSGRFKNSGVVIHPGSCNECSTKRDLYQTLTTITENIVELYNTDIKLGNLLLENSAYTGETVPRTLDEIKQILDMLDDFPDVRPKIGVCIDTCHIFAAGGYDISKTTEITRLYKDLKHIVGLKNIKLIHLNDSRDLFGSHKDNHEILGNGNIFRNRDVLIHFLKVFKEFPMVMETPDNDESFIFTKNEAPQKHILYFDGASKGNPGKSGCGGVVFGPGCEELFKYKKRLPDTTNNVAEYCALIVGLLACKKKKIKYLHVYGDSKLVINQANGEWKVKAEHLIPLHKKVVALCEEFDKIKFYHAKREHNKIADRLANESLH